MKTLKITKENFEKEVLKSDKPVLIDFWAEWCGPCQMLLPTIEEVSKEATGAKICKIDVDQQPELAMEFNVMNIPTLVVMKGGKVVNTSTGVKSKESILEMLKV